MANHRTSVTLRQWAILQRLALQLLIELMLALTCKGFYHAQYYSSILWREGAHYLYCFLNRRW